MLQIWKITFSVKISELQFKPTAFWNVDLGITSHFFTNVVGMTLFAEDCGFLKPIFFAKQFIQYKLRGT